jgi:hypothetical protein
MPVLRTDSPGDSGPGTRILRGQLQVELDAFQ